MGIPQRIPPQTATLNSLAFHMSLSYFYRFLYTDGCMLGLPGWTVQFSAEAAIFTDYWYVLFWCLQDVMAWVALVLRSGYCCRWWGWACLAVVPPVQKSVQWWSVLG
jgi:hypothetical protein